MTYNGFFRRTAAFVGFLGLLLLTPAAVAGDTAWLWSVRLPLVNRATEALAAGHPVRAAHFATAARSAATHAADHLIAEQDLCLALMAQGRAESAQQSCRAAVAAAAVIAPDDDQLVLVRGALTVGVADTESHQVFSLAEAVRGNIARAYGVHIVNHMGNDSTAPW